MEELCVQEQAKNPKDPQERLHYLHVDQETGFLVTEEGPGKKNIPRCHGRRLLWSLAWTPQEKTLPVRTVDEKGADVFTRL